MTQTKETMYGLDLSYKKNKNPFPSGKGFLFHDFSESGCWFNYLVTTSRLLRLPFSDVSL